MNAANPRQQPPEFSLFLGGPLFEIWRRTGLTGAALELPGRRVVVLAVLTWVPLLVLAIAEGKAWGDGVVMPFLYDFESHLRLLAAVPLLLVAEVIAHRRFQVIVRQFTDRGLIPDAAWDQYQAAIASTTQLRNSFSAEGLLLAFVYGVGVLYIWRSHMAIDVASWHGVTVDGQWRPSLAGWWFGCVSLPVYQFLLFRWFFRLFIWARFLWQVSRIELHIMPTHPDRCGGLGFLASVGFALSPLLLSQGVMLAGLIGNRIFYTGAALPDFKVELFGMVAFLFLVVLVPLLVFSPQLEAARRMGLREYGSLAGRYVREFDRKWLHDKSQPGEPLMGSADIQSLADMGTSFGVVKGMTFIPFDLQAVLRLAVTTLLPVAPLLLTMISFEELIDHMLKLII